MSVHSVDYLLKKPLDLHAVFEIRGFTALLGRSGAGKTSLLRALAGLLPAAGTPWNGLVPEARAVGYLPQGAALFPHLTVLENVAYPLRGRDRFARAKALLENLGLGALSMRPGTDISGGQAQRIALARAIARSPQMLLLDEPSAGLDATTRDATLTWLIDTVTSSAIPTLAATHDPTLAGRADWLALLADGRIIQQGIPRQVFENPVSAAAAELLGFENIWLDQDNFYAVRAGDIEIVAEGIPATIMSSRVDGPNLRVVCAAPQPIIILVKAGKPSEFLNGAKIFLKFSRLSQGSNQPPKRAAISQQRR